MTKSEMIVQLQSEVAISALSDSDFENACDDASRETSWSFPVSTDFKIFWMKERAKRALFFYLASQSAHKFKIKQISLNQRFDHYLKIIGYMDGQFKEIVEARPDEFGDVDVYKMFCTKVDSGFAYDGLGRDRTYDADQEVIFNPTD
uniref:Uncharacterized protein n=1 Tax=viral metagenome TaxID=1070528 RepID=A0A6M3IET2_9ZZZZ